MLLLVHQLHRKLPPISLIGFCGCGLYIPLRVDILPSSVDGRERVCAESIVLAEIANKSFHSIPDSNLCCSRRMEGGTIFTIQYNPVSIPHTARICPIGHASAKSFTSRYFISNCSKRAQKLGPVSVTYIQRYKQKWAIIVLLKLNFILFPRIYLRVSQL